MRMAHYFAALAILVVPALLVTAITGFAHAPNHLGFGLFSAIFAVGTHSLLILFMIVTGRVLKEAMAARPLGPQFLDELNQFFAKKSAYPIAFVAVLAIATAAVLGFGHRAFGLPPAAHWVAGLVAIAVNVVAIRLEYRALRANQGLIDRVALELDRLDRERAPVQAEEAARVVYDPMRAARFGLIVGLSAWFPYLYWALIVWKGRFEKVSLHPWIEGSLFGFVVWWIARREASKQPARP